MLNKGNFLTAIKTIKETEDFYMDISRVCREHDVDSSFSDTSMDLKLQEVIVDILMNSMNDIDEFIPWWMYDCNYGKDHPIINVKEDIGIIEYCLDTPEKLYDFLVKYYG